MKTVMLYKGRIVRKSGKDSCHIYLPVKLEGKEVIGVILKEDTDVDIRD